MSVEYVDIPVPDSLKPGFLNKLVPRSIFWGEDQPQGTEKTELPFEVKHRIEFDDNGNPFIDIFPLRPSENITVNLDKLQFYVNEFAKEQVGAFPKQPIANLANNGEPRNLTEALNTLFGDSYVYKWETPDGGFHQANLVIGPDFNFRLRLDPNDLTMIYYLWLDVRIPIETFKRMIIASLHDYRVHNSDAAEAQREEVLTTIPAILSGERISGNEEPAETTASTSQDLVFTADQINLENAKNFSVVLMLAVLTFLLINYFRGRAITFDEMTNLDD